jgi:hypothetical protein
MVLGNACMQ